MDEKVIRVHANFSLSSEEYESITLLYQPLFSYPAMAFYLSLYEHAQFDRNIKVNDLMQILHLDRQAILEQRLELERFNLIRSFNGDALELLLIKPLAPADFFHHTTYARLFTIVMGHKKFIDYSHRYRNEPLSSKNEITVPFDLNRLAIWDESMENMFSEQKGETSPKSYNIDAFFKRISLRLYPAELRTEKIKQILSEMAIMYNLSFADLRAALFGATNFDSLHFDERKFRFGIEKDYGALSLKDVEDPYDLDPISFLKNTQGHDYVVAADKNLIQSLINNFGFSSQVINVLLEYILKNNQNMLNRAYVEKIASVWKRDKVESKDDAFKQIEKPLVSKTKQARTTKQHTAMPIYSKETAIDEDVDDLEKELEAMFKEGE